MSSIKRTIISIIILAAISGTAEALEYTSYIFTTQNIIFFSYEDNTVLEIYDANGNPVLDEENYPVLINGGNPLGKGEHFELTAFFYIKANTVYQVTGSKKFAVLTGDAASPFSEGVSGYYAMDANGLGVSTEFYTYILDESQVVSDSQQFIVFAYEPNTVVTVQAEDTGGVYQDVNTFTLNKGQHWTNPNLDNKYIHITADKPVSALTCYDQGYFVPSANGKWSGTEFYTYVSDIGGPWPDDPPWPEDLTVIAYDDGTFVTIKDSDDPNIVIWSGTLNSGKAHTESYSDSAGGLDRYYTITSSKTVTVSVQSRGKAGLTSIDTESSSRTRKAQGWAEWVGISSEQPSMEAICIF